MAVQVYSLYMVIAIKFKKNYQCGRCHASLQFQNTGMIDSNVNEYRVAIFFPFLLHLYKIFSYIFLMGEISPEHRPRNFLNMSCYLSTTETFKLFFKRYTNLAQIDGVSFHLSKMQNFYVNEKFKMGEISPERRMRVKLLSLCIRARIFNQPTQQTNHRGLYNF